MSTVFLSYCSKDHFFAQLAQHKLEKERIKVWLDGHQLRAGDDWRQEIDRGIADSYAVIVALSAASARSHYVTYEWASAIGKDKPIVPVLLEACDRHPRIEPIQYLDFTNAAHQPWKQLVERLKEIESEREIPASEEQVEAPPDRPDLPVGIPIREAEATERILGYLDRRGYQMVSFERIRQRIDRSYDDRFLDEVIRTHRHVFRPAMLKGGKRGMARL
jgi:hypothetical protein